MIVDYTYENSILEFSFQTEDDDILEYKNNSGCNTKLIKLNNKKCKFVLPNKLENIHSDLLGLTVVLLIYPFVGKNIKLPFPVSIDFANQFLKLGKNISPIDEYLEIRKIYDGKSSLSYSCGTDSTASLLLMPKNTEIIFLDRITPIGSKDTYNKDHIYRTLDYLIADDYKVTLIKSDLEFLREPKGFTMDLACSTPNILLADFFNIDSIAYGYTNHHNEFLKNDIDYICTGDNRLHFTYQNEYPKDMSFSFWNELFNICGLKINMNTMGITEVFTEYIVYNSKYKNIIQSCMRDNCNKCFKCFKINLIKFIFDNNNLNDKFLEELFRNIENEIKKPRYNKTLNTIHEIHKLNTSLLFACGFYHGDNKYINNIKKNYSKYIKDFNYLLKWNPSSKKFMDEKYIDEFLINLKLFTSLKKNF